MAEDLDIEEDLVPVLEVRILDDTKKSSFRVRRLTNFPIAENNRRNEIRVANFYARR